MEWVVPSIAVLIVVLLLERDMKRWQKITISALVGPAAILVILAYSNDVFRAIFNASMLLIGLPIAVYLFFFDD